MNFSNQQQQQQPFGSSSSNAGFNNMNTNTAFGSAGNNHFGSGASGFSSFGGTQPQQQQQQQQQSMSSNPFANNNSNTTSATTAPPAFQSPFGSVPTSTVASTSIGFGNQTSSAFGSSNFGISSSIPQFQQQQQKAPQSSFTSSSSVFGSANTTANNNNPNASISTFGVSPNVASAFSNNTTTSSTNSMFGRSRAAAVAAPSSTTTNRSPFASPFGMNDNNAMNSNNTIMSSGGFGMDANHSHNNNKNMNNPMTTTTTTTMSSLSNNNPFSSTANVSSTSTSITPLNQKNQSNNDTSSMDVNNKNNYHSPLASSFPSSTGIAFGQSSTSFSSSGKTLFGSTANNADSTSTSAAFYNSSFDAKRSKDGVGHNMSGGDGASSKLDELAKLRQKIMLKKKQLEMKKATNTNSTAGSGVVSGGLNPAAAPFTPGVTTTFSTNGASTFQSDSNNFNSTHRGNDDTTSATTTSSKFGRIPKKQRNKNRSSPKPPSFQNTQQQQNGPTTSATNNEENDDLTALANKNAKRFGMKSNNNQNLTSFLPPDLQQKIHNQSSSQAATATTTAMSPTSNQEDYDEQNNNNNIINNDGEAIIGLCENMCPDEELLKRQNENDIQLLEIPHHDIFPKGWTLRDTAVKRFRRSAADYKLNIPELVRPPTVLEKVCGYLEEWVMERDRQGVDPRFTSIPPPLDVYQFIWDRTRMIRKDFILQNYSGTGGKCNAIAVRCHERIARWHCMCEHQLSHIPEFIKMQSQQNVQELGATMKTLNLYYDDADGRATKVDASDDVASHSGLDALHHGCTSDCVMGASPVDYDGKALTNDTSTNAVARRIIGRESATNGTAEPEMRGLYILLTINNDGGMEVLKYSARLSEQSPQVFNSKPVKLALQVYKAKREYNYARFFSILRSSSTPYLFACIMFKYVEQMRKAAFRIMSKTFGARKKDGGSVYDEYPLQDLVHLLCFEDLDEARQACLHYNITVQSVPTSNGNVDVILWRHSDFKEKRDPAKGIVVNLKPQKMNRIIESKLNGATKLAICRGEVSGDGATLGEPVLRTSRRSGEKEMPSRILERSESRRRKVEEERIQQEKQIKEAKRIAEEKKAKEEAQMRLMEIQRKQIEKERKDREAKEAEERAVRKRKEQELLRKKEEMDRREKVEEARIAALKRKEQEEKKRLEQLRLEAAEKLRLEREREVQRQQEEKRQAEERIRLLQEKRRREEAEQRYREETERRRLEILRKREEEEMRRIKEEREKAEEQRIETEWICKLDMAKKFLILSKWRANLSNKRNKVISSSRLLENLDPTKTTAFKVVHEASLGGSSVEANSRALSPRRISYEELFYQLGTSYSSRFDLARMMNCALENNNYWQQIDDKRFSKRVSTSTYLFKLGIYVPDDDVGQKDEHLKHLSSMIKLWVDSRLTIGKVHVDQNSNSDRNVRFLSAFIDAESSPSQRESFDAIMIIVPPTATKTSLDCDFVIEDKLCITIKLSDIESSFAEGFDDVLHDACVALFNHLLSLDNNHLHLVSRNSIIEKVSLKKLCITTFLQLLWNIPSEFIESRSLPSHLRRSMEESGGDRLIDLFYHSTCDLIKKISSFDENFAENWPVDDFASYTEEGHFVIADYFNRNEDLPVAWRDFTTKFFLEDSISEIFPILGIKRSFERFLEFILNGATSAVKAHCIQLCQECQYRSSLEVALQWYEDSYLLSNDHFIYMPIGLVKAVIHEIVERKIRAKEKLICEVGSQLQISLTDSYELNTRPYVENEYDDEEMDNRHQKNTSIGKVQGITCQKSRKQTELKEIPNKQRIKRKITQSSFNDEIKKSKTFTANLRCLVDGGTMDMTIGDSLLSEILDCN